MWLVKSHELNPKFYRWALRVIEFDIAIKWKAGVRNQLPDVMLLLHHPGPLGKEIDDPFQDNESKSNFPVMRTASPVRRRVCTSRT